MNDQIETRMQASALQRTAATFFPCYAYFAIMGIPMIFGALINGMKVSTATATIGTTAEVASMTAASLLVSLFLQRINRKNTMILSALLIIAGQSATLLASDFATVVVARAFTGFGEGIGIGIGLASLARMSGGARLLSHVGGISAVFTWLGFIAVPALQVELGSKAIFWYSLAWAVASLPLAFAIPNQRVERTTGVKVLKGKLFDPLNVTLFSICLLSCIGANACWLYFEQVGEAKGLSPSAIGLVGSTAMLLSAIGPFFATYAFRRVKGMLPLMAGCLVTGVGAHFYITGNVTVFWIVVIVMSITYVFLMAYARLFSATIDPSGRATAAVGGADALGLLMGPVFVATFLNLESGFLPLGQMGAAMQFLCIVPMLALAMARRSKPAFSAEPSLRADVDREL